MRGMRARLAILVLLAILSPGCGQDGGGAPRKGERKRSEAAELLGRKQELMRRKERFELLLREKVEAEQQLRQAMVQLPDASDLPAFLAAVQTAATSAGVELMRFEREAEVALGSVVAVPMVVEVKADLPALVGFFAGLHGDRRIITVENLAIQAAARATPRGRLTAGFRLITFHLAEAPVAAAPAAGIRIYPRVDPRYRAATPRVDRDPFAAGAARAAALDPGAACPGAPLPPPPQPAADEPPARGDDAGAPELDRKQLAVLEREIAQLEVVLRDYDEVERRLADLRRRRDEIARLALARAVPAWLLAELAGILAGAGPTMSDEMAERVRSDPNRAFAADWDGRRVSLTRFAERCGAFTLEGVAAADGDVAQLALRLQASVHFDTILVERIQVADGPGGTRPATFVLTGTVVY